MRVQNRAACLLLACALTIPTTPVPLAFAEGQQDPGVEQNGMAGGSAPLSGSQSENPSSASTPAESGGEGRNPTGAQTGAASSLEGGTIVASSPQSDELVSVTHGSETVGYTTMEEALAAAQDGDTVTLLQDYLIPPTPSETGSYEWKTSCNITFDFNSHAIYSDENSYDKDPGIGF
ncbi:MAG: hypothetical protein ACI36V_06650, partial [Coriobacteriales bacterium]